MALGSLFPTTDCKRPTSEGGKTPPILGESSMAPFEESKARKPMEDISRRYKATISEVVCAITFSIFAVPML